MVNLTILNRVKELRARFNFTQSVLAEKVGVTRQTIAAIEKDRHVHDLYYYNTKFQRIIQSLS